MNLKQYMFSVGLSLTIAGGALGCGSNSEVPDNGIHETPQYRSTSNGDSNTANTGGEGETQAPANGAVPRATGPVATVNGAPVSADEFNVEVDRLVASGQFPPQLLTHVAPQIVERLVDQKLIDGAISQTNIVVSDQDVDAKLEEVRADFAQAAQEMDGDARTLDDMVTELGISQQELRDSIRQSIAIERLLIAGGMKVPTETQVREFYDQNQEMFQRPEQIRARHILVRVEADADEAAWEQARTRAQAIHQQVTQPGANFEEIARTSSEGPSAPQGGDLGLFPRGRMVAEFEEVAFGLQDGQISEPVRTQFGWHIIQVVEHQAPGTVAFDTIQEQLSRELRNQAIQQSLQGFIESLRADAQVELHNENIQ
ncbi:MAG: peptidylprolyl isomerase [Bradymonadaceae bacterium]|nr:peptidylprolyl isomerase [Lujinxingiaceae bacterium]